MRYRVDRRPKEELLEDENEGVADDFGLEDELDFDGGDGEAESGASDGGFEPGSDPSGYDDEGPDIDPEPGLPDPDYFGPEFGAPPNQGSGGTPQSSTSNKINAARKSVKWALGKVNNKLSKKLSSASKAVFDKWFPNATATEKSAIIQTLIDAASSIDSVSIQNITFPPTGPLAGVHNFLAVTRGMPAAYIAIDGAGNPIPGGSQFIALYPGWLAKPGLRPTRLLHEVIHGTDPGNLVHGKSNTDNAWRFQGFVSDLTNLPYVSSKVEKGAGI